MITILGSCRQNSIRNVFSVNNIQEKLNYCHNTKEIIQTLKLCKNIINFDVNVQLLSLRTSILQKSEINFEKIYEEYNNSNLIVIEIASLKCHELIINNEIIQCHHIAYDKPELYNYPQNISNIIKLRKQTEEEIEEDIKQIMELVFPKKILIVTHFATDINSSRYKLINIVENICKKYNITYINPNILLEKYNVNELFGNDTEINLINKEDTNYTYIAHYSKFGHEKIQELYKKNIELLLSQ